MAELEIRRLTFTYLHAPQPTLNDISLQVAPGTITAFVGRVGAGKSTLFRTLNGLIPTILPGRLEGDIIVAGENVRDKDPAFMAQFITLVFDDPTLQLFCLVADEDVAFGPANLNLPREEVWARVRDALELVGLSGFEKRNPRSMSGGEQQLLALAGVIAMRPRIIALDEPVAMLDPIGKMRVLGAIRELNRNYGTTILIADSGSDIEAVCEFAHTMVLMQKGRILSVGSPGELYAQRELVEKSKLKVPQVTRLAYEIGGARIPQEVPVSLGSAQQFVVGLLEASTQKVQTKTGRSAGDSLVQKGAHSSKQDGAVQVRNLCHTFAGDPPVHALKGLSLTIEDGGFVALLGQNGSGKSTLSFHLVGVEKPTNPDAFIKVAGLDVLKEPMSRVIRRVNYLFQNPANQLFCESFGEEVTFGPRSIGAIPKEAEHLGRDALREVGLDHLWEYSTQNMDKSLETLLSLASVLAMRPEILIADEPTGGLDYQAGEKVMEILQSYNRRGKTIIFITHDMELAAKYATRVVILRNGEIWMDGTPREVFSQPQRLAGSQLAPPQITRLGQELARYGLPPNILSVEEFAGLLRSSGAVS